jgi:hypothetical protein
MHDLVGTGVHLLQGKVILLIGVVLFVLDLAKAVVCDL